MNRRVVLVEVQCDWFVLNRSSVSHAARYPGLLERNEIISYRFLTAKKTHIIALPLLILLLSQTEIGHKIVEILQVVLAEENLNRLAHSNHDDELTRKDYQLLLSEIRKSTTVRIIYLSGNANVQVSTVSKIELQLTITGKSREVDLIDLTVHSIARQAH